MARPPKKNSGPVKLGDIVQKFIEQAMPKQMGDEMRVFGRWAQAVGPEISRQAQPKFFRNGMLFVETRHPVWTMELTNKRHVIRKKLNEALGGELVREIQFRQARY